MKKNTYIMATYGTTSCINENHSWQLVVNKLKVLYLMGGENADTWHDHMCQGCTLIAK
jgi:hypothetical protein